MKSACAIAALVAFSTMTPVSLWAQPEPYPARPVKVIVPGPPGGGLDVIARTVVQRLSESSRGQFYIENLPGAGGSIGSGTAARSPADGYTLLVISQDYVIHPLIKTKVPYDPFTSFTPVTLIAEAPETLLVNPSVPAKSMKELADVLKANPGKYNYATPGFGTSPHLANERLFKLTLGTDVVHVPFQGAPPAVASTTKAPTATEVRSQCRAEARAQGLKNEDRVAAVDACYAKILPERAAALKCRHEGKAKGLAGPDLRDFTRQCRANVA